MKNDTIFPNNQRTTTNKCEWWEAKTRTKVKFGSMTGDMGWVNEYGMNVEGDQTPETRNKHAIWSPGYWLHPWTRCNTGNHHHPVESDPAVGDSNDAHETLVCHGSTVTAAAATVEPTQCAPVRKGQRPRLRWRDHKKQRQERQRQPVNVWQHRQQQKQQNNIIFLCLMSRLSTYI